MFSSRTLVGKLDKNCFGGEEGSKTLTEVSLRENERRKIGGIDYRQLFQGVFL